jgi:hypothetical protein
MVLLALAALATAGSLAPAPQPPLPAPPTLPLAAHIQTTGPLTDIWVSATLACQVRTTWAPDVTEFFPPNQEEGDCGTFVAIDGTLYGPSFPSGTATGNLGGYTAYTPDSQSYVINSATHVVYTTVRLGATPYLLHEVDTYTVGDSQYTTQIAITNNGKSIGSSLGMVVYHAGDCYLLGDDESYGSIVTAPPGCYRRTNLPASLSFAAMYFAAPGTDGMEAFYADVWSAVATQGAFPNTCTCNTLQDSGMGVSWSRPPPPPQTSVLIGTVASQWAVH